MAGGIAGRNQASLVLALTSLDPSERPQASELLDLDLLRVHTQSAGAPIGTPMPLQPAASGATPTAAPGTPGADAVLAGATAPSPVADPAVAEALAAKDREIETLRRQLHDQTLMLSLLQSE